MGLYKFDDVELAHAYACVPRFDEGEICQSRQHSDTVRRRTAIFELLLRAIENPQNAHGNISGLSSRAGGKIFQDKILKCSGKFVIIKISSD